MQTRFARLAAAATATAAAFSLVACSSAPEPLAKSSATSSTAAAAPASDVLASIVKAGGKCDDAARGEQSCILDGQAFQLKISGWKSQAALRQQACDEGYVNRDFQILTDGSWTIATDNEANLVVLQSKLGGTLAPYCGGAQPAAPTQAPTQSAPTQAGPSINPEGTLTEPTYEAPNHGADPQGVPCNPSVEQTTVMDGVEYACSGEHGVWIPR